MSRPTMRTYRIRDCAGAVIAEHVRVDLPGGKKAVTWRLPGGTTGDGLMGLSVSDLPLYGTHLLPRVEPGRVVVLTEGEKATEALWSIGIAAVGTVTGAASTPGEDALSVLLPYDAVTWEDHDGAGEGHMARTVARLLRIGGRARRLLWGAEKGDDAADFIARGGTRVTADLLIDAAEPWRIDPADPPRRPIRPVYDIGAEHWRVDAARAQLVDVVEAKLGPPIKKAGRSLLWRCPFHAGDNDPSFKVDTREPFYICFGCPAKGDVFTFLRETEGQDFKTALRELAPPRLLGAAIPW